MEYRRLGSSGLRVSALSFGSWVTFGDQVKIDAASECMKAAFEAGVNFFDNAEAYAAGASETMMGEIVRKVGWKRSDIVVSTKVFWGGAGPNDRGLSFKHVVEGVNTALRRLQMDYVDLVYCHRADLTTPVEETVRAMSLLIQQGKAFYWGTSEWPADMIRDAYGIARRERLVPPTMEQPQYNMFTRERVEKEYARLYGDVGLGTTIWSPLASGLLTGKYNSGVPEGTRLSLPNYGWLRDSMLNDEGQRRIAKVRKLAPIAAECGCTLAQLALAWCLLNPNVSTVITGATRVEQVRENMKALEVVSKLTADVQARIEGVLENKPAAERDFRN